MRWLVTVALLAGCRLHFETHDDAAPGSGDGDGSTGSPDATQFGPWSGATIIPGANTAVDEEDPTGNSTATELYFTFGPDLAGDIYVMTRATTAAAWGAPQIVPNINMAGNEHTPRLSPDDLTLYFASDRATGDDDVFYSTRTSVGGAWSTPVMLAEVSTSGPDKWFSPCNGGRYLIVYNTGGEKLNEGVLGVQAPVRADALNMAVYNSAPYLTPDCNTVYLDQADVDDNLVFATRVSPAAPWSVPQLMGGDFSANGPNESDPWISRDGTLFLFTVENTTSKDLYTASRSPL